MNNIIQDIRKFENLWKRILITMGFTVVYLFGTYLVIPGVDPNYLAGLVRQSGGGLMSLLDMFSGGAFSNASIFALGIMPYILALIILRLASVVVPFFRKMRNEGESGCRKLNLIARFLTIAILVVQGFAYITNLKFQMMQVGAPLPSGWWFILSSVIIMVAGSMFVLWIGERITDKGLGNGILFIFVIGLINRLPQAVIQEFESRFSEHGGSLAMFLAEMLFLLLVVAGTTFLIQCISKVTRKQNVIN